MSALDTIQTRVAQMQAEIDLANERCADHVNVHNPKNPYPHPVGMLIAPSPPFRAALTALLDTALCTAQWGRTRR